MEASELELCRLKSSNQLSRNSWVSLSSPAALFDVRVFNTAAFTHFCGCNYSSLISSTPKFSSNPIKNLKLCGTLQGPLTNPVMVSEGAECVQLCEMAAAGGERRFDMLHPQIQTRERVLASPDFSFSHIFSSFQQDVIVSLRVGDSSNLVHCQTVNMLRDVTLISFRHCVSVFLSLDKFSSLWGII